VGALGAFLEAVRDGIVPKGSWLLVESLDRISREPGGGGLYSEKFEIGSGGLARNVGWRKMGPKTREQTYSLACVYS
jgi:hypothetical protein